MDIGQYVGRYDEMTPEALNRAVRTFRDDRDKFEAMQRKGYELVDSDACARIINTVNDRL
jgi:hypothetical protein